MLQTLDNELGPTDSHWLSASMVHGAYMTNDTIKNYNISADFLIQLHKSFLLVTKIAKDYGKSTI